VHFYTHRLPDGNHGPYRPRRFGRAARGGRGGLAQGSAKQQKQDAARDMGRKILPLSSIHPIAPFRFLSAVPGGHITVSVSAPMRKTKIRNGRGAIMERAAGAGVSAKIHANFFAFSIISKKES
jgi:hypothetical protein